MIVGAKYYAVQVRGKDACYIGHPAKWLNDQCWYDEPDWPPEPERKWWKKCLEEKRAREARERRPSAEGKGDS